MGNSTMSTAKKRRAPMKAPIKRAKTDNGEIVEDDEIEKESDIDEEDDKEELTDSQNDEIRKIKLLLKKAYVDAKYATRNPNIYDLIYVWDKLKLEKSPGGTKKSLARVMHLEEGWTAEALIEWLAPASAPFPVCPRALPREDNRALWMSLRYRYQIDAMKSVAVFPVDLDVKWLGITLKSKTFGKKNATDYTKKLAIDIALHQEKFLGKNPQIWFRALCETLGWDISANFFRYYLIVLFVVCVDPELIANSTKNLGKQWFGKDRIQVKKAFADAVKAGVQDPENMKFPKTFQLFKVIFPGIVKD